MRCLLCREVVVDPPDTVCTRCVRKYLTCTACGTLNMQVLDAYLNGGLRRMPDACTECGIGKVNHNVHAVGLEPTNFDSLDPDKSVLRKRLCSRRS